MPSSIRNNILSEVYRLPSSVKEQMHTFFLHYLFEFCFFLFFHLSIRSFLCFFLAFSYQIKLKKHKDILYPFRKPKAGSSLCFFYYSVIMPYVNLYCLILSFPVLAPIMSLSKKPRASYIYIVPIICYLSMFFRKITIFFRFYLYCVF